MEAEGGRGQDARRPQPPPGSGHLRHQRFRLALAQSQPTHRVAIGDPDDVALAGQRPIQQPGHGRAHRLRLAADAVGLQAKAVNRRPGRVGVAGVVDREGAQPVSRAARPEEFGRQPGEVVPLVVGAGDEAGVEGQQHQRPIRPAHRPRRPVLAHTDVGPVQRRRAQTQVDRRGKGHGRGARRGSCWSWRSSFPAWPEPRRRQWPPSPPPARQPSRPSPG